MLLTMEEIKAQLRLDEDFDTDDRHLQLLACAAQKRTETYLNRKLYVQSIHLFKDGSVTAQRGWGVEAARAAATALFAMTCMWRRIRTEEYSIKTAGDQFTQCLLVNIAFEDG